MPNNTVILIQPLGNLAEPNGYMRTCQLEPLALEYLAAAVENEGYQVKILPGNISNDELLSSIEQTKPIAVGFSVYTYVFEKALSLAKAAKLKARKMGYNLYTIFGGYHSSALPEAVASEPDVDFVVIGEGEVTFSELLNVLSDAGDPGCVPGLVFEKEGKLIRTGPRNRISNLDLLPQPKRYPKFLNLAKQYQIAYPPPSKQKNVAQVTYSRGCPFSCHFCASENTWGRQVLWRSPKLVLDEIEMLVKDFGTNLVYFPDLTFNVSRTKVLELCSEFKARRLPVHWWALFRADLIDEEMLEALVEANCVKLSLGIESPNEQVTKTVKGFYNTKKEKLLQILHYANDLGLIIKAFLIIGFINDTSEIIRSYKDELLSYPIDELRVTIATPFPGTKFWNECLSKGFVTTTEWSQFTTERLVFSHPSITENELLDLRKELVAGFYLDPLYARHTQLKLQRFPHLLSSWLEYFHFIEAKKVFGGHADLFQDLMDSLMRPISVMRNNDNAMQAIYF